MLQLNAGEWLVDRISKMELTGLPSQNVVFAAQELRKQCPSLSAYAVTLERRCWSESGLTDRLEHQLVVEHRCTRYLCALPPAIPDCLDHPPHPVQRRPSVWKIDSPLTDLNLVLRELLRPQGLKPTDIQTIYVNVAEPLAHGVA